MTWICFTTDVYALVDLIARVCQLITQMDPRAALERLETTLVCSICRSLFDCPTVTQCGHTFCGVCIRRYITAASSPNCPLCTKTLDSSQLRANTVVDDILEAFQQLAQVLKVRNQGVPSQETPPPQEEPQHHQHPPHQPHNETQQPDTYAQCPVCQRHMLLSEIQSTHIAECLASKKPQKQKSKPAVNYSFKTDKALRDLLRGENLSSTGSRKRLIARHQEWLVLYNTNVDSRKPKPVSELQRSLKNWERQQDAVANVPVKDVDPKEWVENNRYEYDELTKQAFESLGLPGPRKRPFQEVDE